MNLKAYEPELEMDDFGAPSPEGDFVGLGTISRLSGCAITIKSL
jgi:hypothetical protein